MNMDEQQAALVLGAGEGDLLKFQGLTTRIKVRSEMTNGGLTLIETTVEPHFKGFDLHTHTRITETFYVLEGTLTVQLDADKVELKPGGLVVVPPGVWHTYWNAADEQIKYLLFISPGGFEKYLEGLLEMMHTEPQWPPADTTKLNALAAKYDVTAQDLGSR